MENPNVESIETTGVVNPAVVQRAYVTFEEYLEHSSDKYICEWIDGEVIEVPGASFEHQNLSGFLESVIRFYVEKNELGVVVGAPFAMKLEAQRRGREPDILFVARERADIIRHTFLDGPADLAVELISPESITRDRAEKFVEYEAAGIKEFWLIDPDRKIGEFYGLSDAGQYSLLPVENGVFRSQVIGGFFLKLDWLWQPFPSSVDALRELGQIQ